MTHSRSRLDYIPEGKTTRLPSDGTPFTISASDYDRVVLHHWYAHRNQAGATYIRANIVRDGRHTSIGLGRYLLDITDPDLSCDHKVAGETLDNSREALRVATRSQQQQNRRVRSDNLTSGYKGVTFGQQGQGGRRRYRAQIWIGGTNHLILRTDSLIEAVCYYNIFAALAFGPFACLNDLSSFTKLAA